MPQDEPASPPQATAATPPLAFPPLTSVAIVLCHTGARVEEVALPHAVEAICSFLDYALPTIWSLPRACETNFGSLLPRLAARTLATGVDPFYWKLLCRQGLVSAVTHDNLEMVELLHAYCPSVLPYLPMVEAARAGNLRLLERVSVCHESAPWLPHAMDAAASTGQLQVLQWLHDHPTNAECTTDAFESAAVGGHLDTVKWLLEHYGDGAKIVWQAARDTDPSQYAEVIKCLLEDLEMVQWLFAKSMEAGFSNTIGRLDRKLIDIAASRNYLYVMQWLHEHHPNNCMREAMDKVGKFGHLEVVQWLHKNRTEGCTFKAMDGAASNEKVDVVKWLHDNRNEGCALRAIDHAVSNGHLSTVKWLHEN